MWNPSQSYLLSILSRSEQDKELEQEISEVAASGPSTESTIDGTFLQVYVMSHAFLLS